MWLGHLQARYEGWILAHPTRSHSVWAENDSPQNTSVKYLEMFFLGSTVLTGKISCKRSITPRNVCQKTNLAPLQQAHFKRIVEAARATDEGSQSLAHFLEKYRHHLSQKLSERRVPNLSNFSPSLFKHSLTLAHFWQRE